MSWLELDDRILEHPKFVRAIRLEGSDALHLWLGIRAYCGQNLSDGFVPEDMLEEVRGPSNPRKRKACLAALRTVGLIDSAEGGVQMHDYLDWSSSREEVLARRESARERKRRSRGGSATPEHETPAGVSPPSRCDSARTASEVRRESPTPARAFPLPSPPHPTNPDLTAAADPRPESLPRASAPDAAAAAAAAASGSGLPEPASGTHRTAPEKRVDTQVRERLPSNLEEAVRVPICERAALVVSGRVAAQWLQPECWREVIEVEAALAEGEGRKPLPLGRYDRDTGVQAIVALYAAGFMPGDVKRVAREVPGQPWWRSGGRRGLASLSPEVMRRGLAPDAAEAAGRDLLAAVDRDLAKAERTKPDEGGTQLGALVGRIAGGVT